MACTLLATPSVGTSDWTNFITQVEEQRTGFMRLSFTNFSGSVASAVATGGIVDIAGSIYQFTETSITYTGAPSTNTDLYIYVEPDAAVSTASVVATDATPVWIDAKQGFYGSAASLKRYVGGMYVGSAGRYYNKYLYQGEHLTYCLETGETRPILKKILQIGEWNMDAMTTVSIVHGLGSVIITKIVGINAVIRDDTGTAVFQCNKSTADWTANELDILGCNTTVIGLNRQTGGGFDSISYNATASTVANRGWIFIEYVA